MCVNASARIWLLYRVRSHSDLSMTHKSKCLSLPSQQPNHLFQKDTKWYYSLSSPTIFSMQCPSLHLSFSLFLTFFLLFLVILFFLIYLLFRLLFLHFLLLFMIYMFDRFVCYFSELPVYNIRFDCLPSTPVVWLIFEFKM